MKKLLSCFFLLFIVSCSSSKKVVPSDQGTAFAEKVFGLIDKMMVPPAPDETPNVALRNEPLKVPFSVGVTFLPPEDPKVSWKWGRSEKDQFLKSLSRSHKVSKVFEVFSPREGTPSYNELRSFAAQQGAQTLLVIRGFAEVQSKPNAKALSYVALLPMLFVEGNTVTSAFTTQAILWDVRAPFIRAGLETEGDWKMDRPLAFRQQERAVTKSREEALVELVRKFNSQI